MAAPIYSQSEVDSLVAMAKRIPDDDVLQPRTPAQKRKARRRINEFEEVSFMRCEPAEPLRSVALEVELCHNKRNDAISITLYAQIAPRPIRPICRYDVHDVPHENPPWFPPPLIEPGQFHQHLYSERAIREIDEEAWCACAAPLDVGLGGSPQTQLARLRKRFLADLHIAFDDRATRGLFMSLGE
jgi:hypothetical protein